VVVVTGPPNKSSISIKLAVSTGAGAGAAFSGCFYEKSFPLN